MYKYSIILRPFQEDDYLVINKWRNDYNVQKMTGGPIRFVSLDIEKNWVKSKMQDNIKDIYLAICLNDDSQRMIGYISLNNIDHLNKSADAGGTVIGDKEYQDGQTVFEALTIVLEYAFDQLNLNRISAECLPEHYLAPYSLGAFGFIKEGTKREAIYKNGKYHNLDLYSLLRFDYDRLRSENRYTPRNLVKECIKLKKQTKS